MNTLTETNISPENRPVEKERSSSKHCFTGAMLVSCKGELENNGLPSKNPGPSLKN